MYNGKVPTTHFYVVGPNGEFADVVVSLKGVTGKSTGASAPPAVLDQKGCLYSPQILAVQTGQKIIVRNSDICVHNVHCTPAVAGNPEHNDVQMAGGADLTYTFPKPEMFLRFKCDVHPWMFAWVSVFDSPVFFRQRQGRQIRHQKRAARQIHRRGQPSQTGRADAGRGSRRQGRDREFHLYREVKFRGGKPRHESRGFVFQKMNAKAQTQNNPWLHRFAVLTAVITFLLIGLGGLVTSHEAGMSVPDWPTSYGYNMFALPIKFWHGGAFFEHTHRLLASGAGFLTTILAVWLWLKDPRKWMKWLGVTAFLLVVAQGVLGGLRVTMHMDSLGVFHGVVAQSYFVLMCAIALFTSRFWSEWSDGEKSFLCHAACGRSCWPRPS